MTPNHKAVTMWTRALNSQQTLFSAVIIVTVNIASILFGIKIQQHLKNWSHYQRSMRSHHRSWRKYKVDRKRKIVMWFDCNGVRLSN